VLNRQVKPSKYRKYHNKETHCCHKRPQQQLYYTYVISINQSINRILFQTANVHRNIIMIMIIIIIVIMVKLDIREEKKKEKL